VGHEEEKKKKKRDTPKERRLRNLPYDTEKNGGSFGEEGPPLGEHRRKLVGQGAGS